ncbi:MAG: hypothetical protein ACT4PU_08935 [Planctomycetota bacterium]
MITLCVRESFAQAESKPSVDPAVQHLQAPDDFIEQNANFGFSMGAGRLRGPGDPLDDIVICALAESVGGRAQVGAAYVFEDEELDAPDDKPHRLTPNGTANMGAHLGELAVAIGNPRGEFFNESTQTEEAFANLILIGCYGRDAEYPGSSPSGVADGGSVEVYNFMASSDVSTVQRSLFAPKNQGPNALVVPIEVEGFGHGLALGDITRDGTVDLVVGAPRTNLPGSSPTPPADEGRFYIFAGHEDFYSDPHASWVAVNAVDPDDTCENWGAHFGCQVSLGKFSGASENLDVVVGRQDRPANATIDTPQDAPLGGSAYVFRNSYLYGLFQGYAYHPTTNPTGTLKRANRPPPPDLDYQSGGPNPSEPEYQVLRNPFGDLQDTAQNPEDSDWHDSFGWFVHTVGDVGSPGGGALDGVDDMAVYAEVTDFIGTGSLSSPQVVDVGGLFIYFGIGDTDVDMVDPDYLLLQRPSNVGTPQQGARFGRSVAYVESLWNPVAEEVQPALLIGEPDADWNSIDRAGLVHLIRLPLPAAESPPYYAADIANAWGSTPLLEPEPADEDEEGDLHMFGSWIVALSYHPSGLGQQLIISARQADVEVDDVVLTGAGRAFPFLWPEEE